MIAYFETAKDLSAGRRTGEDEDFFANKVQRLYDTSRKISFDTLESVMYKLDERNSRFIQSFLDVFRLRSDELLLEIVRKLKRTPTPENRFLHRFSKIEDFINDRANANGPDRLSDLSTNFKSRLELMSQLFPKIELLLFKIPDAMIDEQIYFDASRLASSTGTRSATSKSSGSLIDVGQYLYKDIFGSLQKQLGDWLSKDEAGKKPFDKHFFESMLNLKKFNVVQNHLYNNECRDTNKKEIESMYKIYGEPDGDKRFEIFDFDNKDSLTTYFEKIKKFLESLPDGKQSGGFLSDVQDVKRFLDLREDVLKAALIDKEGRLNKMEQRGGRIIDTNTIIPYDIRKLNAVLTRINDMVAANLKDLQKTKAAGFENAQYETKLKKLETDLLEKENLLSQFDGITKQSIERALLLEHELVKHNQQFEAFCLFLMGRRQDLNRNESFFDASKNVFGFRKEGRPIFEDLDWHNDKQLKLPKDELVFKSFADKDNIKRLFHRKSSKLSYKTFENLLEGLVSCHSYLQNSDSFYEEDMILREIVSLRSILEKLKNDENENKMTLEARFEDLKDLNDKWKLEISCKHEKANINDRNIKALFSNLKIPPLPSKVSYVLSLIDSIKGKPSTDFWINKAEFASQKNDTQEMNLALTNLFYLKDKSGDPHLWLVLTLIEWPSIMEKYKIYNEPNDDIQQALISMNTGLNKLEQDCRDIIDLFRTTENEKIKDKATDILIIVKEALALLDIVVKPQSRASTGLQRLNSLGKRIFPKLFGSELSSKFAVSVKALVAETIMLARTPSHSGGGGIGKDSAKQFINQSDRLLELFKNILLPSKALADTGEVVKDQSPQTYDSFVSTVMSTAGRENLEAMLEKLNRVSSEIRKTPDSQDDDNLQISTLLRVASKLLQERLECQNRTDELSETLGEKLYQAEKSFRRQVEECNDRIHSANQKLLKAEEGHSYRGSTRAKGDGIAYGYVIRHSLTATPDDNESIIKSANEISSSETPPISLPPPYDSAPQELATEQANGPQSDFQYSRKDDVRDRDDIGMTKQELIRPPATGLTSDMAPNSDDVRDPGGENIKIQHNIGSPQGSPANVTPEIPSIDPWKGTETSSFEASLKKPSDDEGSSQTPGDPWVGVEIDRGVTPQINSAVENNPEHRSNEIPTTLENPWATETSPKLNHVNQAFTPSLPVDSDSDRKVDDDLASTLDSDTPPMSSTVAPTPHEDIPDMNVTDSVGLPDNTDTIPQTSNDRPKFTAEIDRPATANTESLVDHIDPWNENDKIELDPNLTDPIMGQISSVESSADPKATDPSAKTQETVSDAWESIAAEKTDRTPDTNSRFKPRQKLSTASDAVFSSGWPARSAEGFPENISR